MHHCVGCRLCASNMGTGSLPTLQLSLLDIHKQKRQRHGSEKETSASFLRHVCLNMGSPIGWAGQQIRIPHTLGSRDPFLHKLERGTVYPNVDV